MPPRRKPLHCRTHDMRPAARIGRIVAIEPVARTVLFHPVAFVGIVAGAEIDQCHMIPVDHMFEQRGGQRRPGRKRLLNVVPSAT